MGNHIEYGQMKFNLCIMNPPYHYSLHLQILEKVLNFCDKVVNISPSKIFTNPYIEYERRTREWQYRVNFSKRLASLEVISSSDSNSIFDTSFWHTLAISVFNKNTDELFNLDKYKSQNTLVIKLVKAISDMDSLHSKFAKPENDKFYCPVRRTNHGFMKWVECDFDKIKAVEGINFNTLTERENFIKSFDTWFYNFLNKTDWTKKADSTSVPYMQDYTKPWTNRRFCEYFKITGYISDTEAEPGSEWETILNTIK